MPKLSDSLKVKGLSLRNRLVIPPMVTGLAVKGIPTKTQLNWYAQLAKSGASLVIVEAASILPGSQILPNQIDISPEAPLGPLATLALTIQRNGAPAILQIVHGGGRAWRPDVSVERVAPSNVAIAPGPAPRALSEPEIEELIAAFVAASVKAQLAGFDGVEIHAAHYYLISQFLSPFTNHRTDTWGGSVTNRARFAVETIRAVRKEVGVNYPIFVRINAEERFELGLASDDIVEIARQLESAGADVLDASAIGQTTTQTWEGNSFINTMSVLPKTAPAGSLAAAAGRIKAALRIPVIAVGKLGEPNAAQRVLDEGQADLVAIARQVIADPATPQKLLEGRDSSIVRCKECLSCLASIRQGSIRCSVNKELAAI